jgi:hypothetical protein
VFPLASKRDFSNGVDWMEVTVLINAIEALHGVDVSLAMSLDGAFKPYRMQVVAIAVKLAPNSMEVSRSVSRKRFYPSVDAKSMAGLCYRLLHELDRDCGEMWKQETFT